jgi:30S ribosomal protein S31
MDHEFAVRPATPLQCAPPKKAGVLTKYTWRFVIMGKGDRKTRKGKIWRNSYGKTRPHKDKKKG